MTTAYEIARGDVGTLEWGKGDNPKVLAYFQDAGHPEIKDDETAWCAAFVGAMIKRAGGVPTGSLAARSYLVWGTPVALQDAQLGDVVVFQRGNSAWQGHVGFFVKREGAQIHVLGGNQGNQVSVAVHSQAKLLGVRRDAKAVASMPVAASPVPDPDAKAAINKNPVVVKEAPVVIYTGFLAWLLRAFGVMK